MDRLVSEIGEISKLLDVEESRLNRIRTAEGHHVDIGRPGTSSQSLDTGGFENVGEMMQAIYSMSKGRGMDRRLENLRIAAAAQQTGLGSAGGFLVPPQFAVAALESALEDTVLLRLCDRVEMTATECSVPAYVDENHSTSAPYGITWSQITESGSFGTTQNVQTRKVKLEAHKSGALFAASNEWLSDANVVMRDRLQTIFMESLRWYVEKLLWTGTGAGQPLGALTAAGTITTLKETGQAASTIVTKNITKMWSRLLPGAHARSIWVCNPNAFPSLAGLTISVGTGGAPVGLLQGAPAGIAGAPAGTIFGRPLFFSEHCKTVGTIGDIVLCDPLRYVLGDRRQIAIDVSPHLRFDYDETVFRCQWRGDGQPAMTTALTPENGSTASWLVKLETRS